MGCSWSSIVEEVVNQVQASTTTTGGDSASSVYDQLPSNAEKCTVRNVYDGDTLTLVDERRVRLLGIDTPEIKEKQPYAEEAKAYTKDRCHKKEIWISYEPNGEKQDHYGRLLAFVWVPADNGSGYLCINEGIVENGYASAYRPNSDTTLHNWDKLVALQKSARDNKRGMWSTFKDYSVVATRNGSAYHLRSCEHLANTHNNNLTEMMASDATDKGLHPCRTCLS